MLQEYWASTVIFIGIFSQCKTKHTKNLCTYEAQVGTIDGQMDMTDFSDYIKTARGLTIKKPSDLWEASGLTVQRNLIMNAACARGQHESLIFYLKSISLKDLIKLGVVVDTLRVF